MTTLYDRLSRARRQAEADGQPQAGLRVVEPRDQFSDLRRKIHSALLRSLGPKLYEANMTPDQLASRVRRKLAEALDSEQLLVSAAERQRLVTEITDDILGYGPIEPFLRDASVTEIMVNGPDAVYVERGGKLHKTDVRFHDDAHLRRIIEKIVAGVGRRIDESQPYVDARLLDGSRVNAVIPPVAVDGPTMTIRKFSREPFRAEDLVGLGTMPAGVARFLEACVNGRVSVMVSGGTGVGKTTLLNVLSSFIPPDERIVTIEDAAELQLLQPHVVRLEARPSNIEGRGEVTVRDLVRNALRMRPDRIVVGEVRGPETLDMLQAMNTGHDGSMSTVHANAPRDALSRLETMCLMAGMDLPLTAIRSQLARAVQLIVHQARLRDGSRRVTYITEVVGMQGDVIALQDVFTFDHSMGFDTDGRSRGTLKATGLPPTFTDRLEDLGVHVDRDVFAPGEPPTRSRRRSPASR